MGQVLLDHLSVSGRAMRPTTIDHRCHVWRRAGGHRNHTPTAVAVCYAGTCAAGVRTARCVATIDDLTTQSGSHDEPTKPFQLHLVGRRPAQGRLQAIGLRQGDSATDRPAATGLRSGTDQRGGAGGEDG